MTSASFNSANMPIAGDYPSNVTTAFYNPLDQNQTQSSTIDSSQIINTPAIDSEAIQQVHQAPIPPQDTSKLAKAKNFFKDPKIDKIKNQALFITNGFGVGFSFLAAFAGAILGQKSSTVKFLESINQTATRFAIGGSAVVNTLITGFDNDVFSCLGYGVETLLSAFIPFDVLGLSRGLSFFLYQIPEIASTIKPLEESSSWGHNIKQVFERGSEIVKFLFKPDTYTEAYKSLSGSLGKTYTEDDAKRDKLLEVLLGGWGGIISVAGVLTWLATKSSALGGFVKGIGELTIDFFHITPNQKRRERDFFVGAGYTFLFGSTCEILNRIFKDVPVLRNLYFFGSMLGRMQMSISKSNQEVKYLPEIGPAEGWDNKITYIGMFNKLRSLVGMNPLSINTTRASLRESLFPGKTNYKSFIHAPFNGIKAQAA